MARALQEISDGLLQTSLVPIETSDLRGPPSGVPQDKSRFVRAIEEALLEGHIDLAVHSAKDVPGALPQGLAIVGAPEAEDPRDALVGGAGSLAKLPAGARVGTASLRRRSQLLALRPDIEIVELHGNVDTRLRKVEQDDYDAAVLALAGLRRLDRAAAASFAFEVGELVPAPGQGILALEAREDDAGVAEAAQHVTDPLSLRRLEAERAVVEMLDTSCHTPVGAHASIEGGAMQIQAYAGLPDGSEWIRDEVKGDDDPVALGRMLAKRMLAAGADELLRRAEAT